MKRIFERNAFSERSDDLVFTLRALQQLVMLLLRRTFSRCLWWRALTAANRRSATVTESSQRHRAAKSTSSVHSPVKTAERRPRSPTNWSSRERRTESPINQVAIIHLSPWAIVGKMTLKSQSRFTGQRETSFKQSFKFTDISFLSVVKLSTLMS